MNENYNIRRATAGDAQILAYIQTESWKAAFQNILEPEDLEQSTNPERATAMYQNFWMRKREWLYSRSGGEATLHRMVGCCPRSGYDRVCRINLYPQSAGSLEKRLRQ